MAGWLRGGVDKELPATQAVEAMMTKCEMEKWEARVVHAPWTEVVTGEREGLRSTRCHCSGGSGGSEQQVYTDTDSASSQHAAWRHPGSEG